MHGGLGNKIVQRRAALEDRVPENVSFNLSFSIREDHCDDKKEEGIFGGGKQSESAHQGSEDDDLV
jgi:hypothetical protein